MSGIAKLQSPSPLQELGFDVFGERSFSLKSIDDQIVETNQVFTDLGLADDKMESLNVSKLRAGSLRVDDYIQSTGFVTGTTGWQILGNGNAEFANITLTGGTLKYGKTSFADFTNSGYYISSSGVHIGKDASTFLTYTISSGALLFTGGDITGVTSIGATTISATTFIGNIFETSAVTNSSRIRITKDSNTNPTQSANSIAFIESGVLECEIKPGTGSVDDPIILGTFTASTAQVILKATNNTSGVGGAMVDLAATHASGTVTLLKAVNTGTSAPINAYGGVVSTNFRRLLKGNSSTIWESDTTTPNGNLTGTAGDICLNGDSGNIYRCTGTTTWVAM